MSDKGALWRRLFMSTFSSRDADAPRSSASCPLSGGQNNGRFAISLLDTVLLCAQPVQQVHGGSAMSSLAGEQTETEIPTEHTSVRTDNTCRRSVSQVHVAITCSGQAINDQRLASRVCGIPQGACNPGSSCVTMCVVLSAAPNEREKQQKTPSINSITFEILHTLAELLLVNSNSASSLGTCTQLWHRRRRRCSKTRRRSRSG